MEQDLESLEQKQRKLMYLFGEQMFELHRKNEVRLRFFSADKEKEIRKILELLAYLEDRIARVEEIYDADEDLDAEDEVEVAPLEEETVSVEASLPVMEDVVEEEAPVLDEPELLVVEEEPLMVEASTPETTAASKAFEAAVNQVVAEEHSQSAPMMSDTIDTKDILAEILETAVFNSAANKRLFAKDIKQFSLGNELEREISIGQLAHITPKEALAKVYALAMKDPSPLVRFAVVKNISRMKDDKDEVFFGFGLNDPDPKVRVLAIKGLGTHVSDKHRKVLEELLKDEDALVRGLAVTYLGIYYGKEGVRKAILSWKDESPHVRASLLELISIVKPDGALAIVKNLLSDKDASVKKAAEKALEKLMPEKKGVKDHGKKRK